MKTPMKTKPKRLIEPNFWRHTSVIWGFATGGSVALTLVVAVAYLIFRSSLAVVIACLLMTLLTAPITLAMIKQGNFEDSMPSRATIVGGYVAFVVAGFVIPFVLIPGVVHEFRKLQAERPQQGHPTGKEVFYSLPNTVARHAGQELAATFFHNSGKS